MKKFDVDGSNSIDYSEFRRGVADPISGVLRLAFQFDWLDRESNKSTWHWQSTQQRWWWCGSLEVCIHCNKTDLILLDLSNSTEVQYGTKSGTYTNTQVRATFEWHSQVSQQGTYATYDVGLDGWSGWIYTVVSAQYESFELPLSRPWQDSRLPLDTITSVDLQLTTIGATSSTSQLLLQLTNHNKTSLTSLQSQQIW